MNVVIAAGGTAGHVVPALAVAAALQAEGVGVSFLGARDRVEAELVPAAGFEIELLRLRGLDRRNPVRAAAAAGLALRAVPAARAALRRRSPCAVLGAGGFVAGPAGIAALTLGLPLVLSEADRHLGLANRLLAPRARRVCLAFPIPGRDSPRYVVTGRPVPRAILGGDRDTARARFGIGAGDDCVLVFGGSQGARTVNRAALDAFALPGGEARPFHVLHIAGRRDYPEARQRVDATLPERYTLLEYEPDLGAALAACDLVIARAGGSIFELAAAGRPAVLVPYPYAAGRHQHANAAWMAEAGAAIVIEDAQLDGPRLRTVAAELFADPARLRAMAEASLRIARPDAAELIAAELVRSCQG